MAKFSSAGRVVIALAEREQPHFERGQRHFYQIVSKGLVAGQAAQICDNKTIYLSAEDHLHGPLERGAVDRCPRDSIVS